MKEVVTGAFSWRWRFCWKQSAATSGELYSQKAPPQTLNQQSDCTFRDNLTSLLTILMRNTILY